MGAKITAESILEMSRSFMASRVLLSGAELDIFTLLAEQPLTDEIKEGLTAAGFTRINLIQTKGMFSLVEGFKS